MLISSHKGALRIDGINRGQVKADTARKIKDLEGGDHFIKIEGEGCLPWSDTVHVTAGQSNVLHVKLEAAPVEEKRVKAEVKSPVKEKRKTPAVTVHSPAYTNSIGMEFVLIKPGTFLMGSEKGSDDEKPVHEVEITQPFYMGKYPCHAV